MNKVLYVYGGGEKFHPSRATGELLSLSFWEEEWELPEQW